PSLIDKIHPAPSASISADAPKIKDAIARLAKGQMSEAMAIRATLKDRAAVTLFDWLLIRAASRQAGFQMIAGVLNAHPDWPAPKLIKKRAEEALYLEDLDAGTIRAFIGNEMPESGLGKLALARISGKKEAASLVKNVWREDDLTPDTEKKVLSEFGD